jgi:hypothetical protein
VSRNGKRRAAGFGADRGGVEGECDAGPQIQVEAMREQKPGEHGDGAEGGGEE